MSEALSLSDSLCRMDTFTEYQRGEILKAAAELRRLAQMEAEVSQLRADANNCGSGAGCCYQAAQNERLELELQQAREELSELGKQVESWRKHCDTLTHQVICCGVAASHPDATLTTRGAYAEKWNSAQAEQVRKLRIDRDQAREERTALLVNEQNLREELAALRASLSEPVAYSMTSNGEHTGNVYGNLEHAQERKAAMDQTWPDRVREIVPLFAIKDTK